MYINRYIQGKRNTYRHKHNETQLFSTDLNINIIYM